jgi:hypothetical protein
VVSSCEHGNEPSGSKNARNLSSGCTTGGLSSGVQLRGVNKSLKNGVFWVVTPCGSCKNRRFGGTWRLLNQGDKNR